MRRLLHYRNAATQMMNTTIWEVDTDALPFRRRVGVVTLRVLSILQTTYFRNRIGQHASALTNITLMSIVPVLAFVFALAKGMGLYRRLMDPIDASLGDPASDLPHGVAEMLKRLLEFIQSTDISALGPLAIALTLYTIISVIGKIETSFNAIWSIEKDRDFVTKFKDYTLLIFLMPVAFVAASSINAVVKMESIRELLSDTLGEAGAALSVFVGMVFSLLLLSLALTYMYRFLPNTRVRFWPAFVSGIVTTLAWFVVQRLYVKFQIGVASANSIYGAFATVPLFLAWLNLSWLVVLLGGQLAYALQCHRDFEIDDIEHEIAPGILGDACVVVFGDLSEHFRRGGRWRMSERQPALKLPTRVFRRAVSVLARAGLLVETRERETYVPAENTSRITLDDLQRAFAREHLDPALLPAGEGRVLLEALRAERAKLDAALAARPVSVCKRCAEE